MNDRQTYATRQEAQEEAARMVGWVVKPVAINVDDGNNNTVERWGLMVKQGKTTLWLREDGYVR